MEGVPRDRPSSDQERGTSAFLSFDREIEFIVSHMSHGVSIVRRSTFDARDALAAIALLAAGAEHLLKVTYGLLLVSTGGAWPTRSEFQSINHDIVSLDRQVRDLLLANSVQRRGAALLRGALA